MDRQVLLLLGLLFVAGIARMDGAEHKAKANESKLQPMSPLVVQAHVRTVQLMQGKHDPSGAFYIFTFDRELTKLMRAVRLERRQNRAGSK